MKAKNLGKGKYADGQGLWLVKARKDGGKWILRIVVDGKRREMGLGRWPDVSIAEARESASEARKKLRGGVDPIQERRAQKLRTNCLTVADAVHGCFEAKRAELKNGGHAGRWMSPLSVHVLPKIGKLAIEDIDQHELKRVMEPIWHSKPDTARKAMNRLNLTLKHAAALGLDVDLQAVMKAQALLGKRRATTKHIPSLPYQEAPSFYQWLCGKPFVSALALRFLILTVARTSEVRFATFSEVERDVWIIPPDRTKTSKEHRIPLSDEAQAVIDQARQEQDQELLFPTLRGKPMSDATMSRFMEREGYNARPHGFRATFRSWAEECTDARYEVKETALGHQVGSDVERAYQRSDLLEKRRLLLAEWSTYLMPHPS
jgi:integrase